MCVTTADNDNDSFAAGSSGNLAQQQFRGADFRGADCNDADPTIYAGRQTTTYGPSVDHNCNGIFGTTASVGAVSLALLTACRPRARCAEGTHANCRRCCSCCVTFRPWLM